MAAFFTMLLIVLNSHFPAVSCNISILDPVAHLVFLMLAELRGEEGWRCYDDVTFPFLPMGTPLTDCSPVRNHCLACLLSREE